MKRSMLLLALALPALVSWKPAPMNPFAVVGAPHPMRGFDEVMTVLNGGGQVRVVFDYAKCQLQGDDGTSEAGPEALGGMPVDTWEYFAKGAVGNERAYVSASETKLIGRKKREGGFVHLLNYVKFRFSDDNKVEVTAQYLVPTTYEVKMHEVFICELNNGKNPDKGAIFYRVR